MPVRQISLHVTPYIWFRLRLCIAGLVALSKRGVDGEVPYRFHPHAHVHALVEKLVDQPGANERGGGGRNIAKVVVRDVERQSILSAEYGM